MVAGDRGAETRKRILAVSLELFAAHGYAGASIRDIAEGMGLTKAALYYHFASKEEILDAVTEPFVSEFRRLAERAAMRPPPPAAELLGGLVDILSRRVALIRTVMADPSIPRRLHRPEMLEQLRSLAAALADGGGATAELRAVAAIGAAQFASFSTVMSRTAAGGVGTDSPAPGPPDADRGERLLEGSEHLLTAGERDTILQAALRALHAAAP